MPSSGEQHRQFPNCYWSPPLNNYACDDGYTVDGQELPPGWEQSIFDIQSVYDTAVTIGAGVMDAVNDVRITEIGSISPTQLSAVIRQSGGQFDVSISDPLVAYAQSQWWLFSVQFSNDGTQARITENNYLLYGGVGIGALVLLMLFSRR